jgi:hypothetical protein
MRFAHALALAALLVVVAQVSQADTKWRKGATCGSGTETTILDASSIVSWCPGAVTTPSKPLKFAAPTVCQWGDGGGGQNVILKGAFNNVVRWVAPGGIACDTASTPDGPCSFFTVQSGEILTMEQSVANATAQVVCAAGDLQ